MGHHGGHQDGVNTSRRVKTNQGPWPPRLRPGPPQRNGRDAQHPAIACAAAIRPDKFVADDDRWVAGDSEFATWRRMCAQRFARYQVERLAEARPPAGMARRPQRPPGCWSMASGGAAAAWRAPASAAPPMVAARPLSGLDRADLHNAHRLVGARRIGSRPRPFARSMPALLFLVLDALTCSMPDLLAPTARALESPFGSALSALTLDLSFASSPRPRTRRWRHRRRRIRRRRRRRSRWLTRHERLRRRQGNRPNPGASGLLRPPACQGPARRVGGGEGGSSGSGGCAGRRRGFAAAG